MWDVLQQINAQQQLFYCRPKEHKWIAVLTEPLSGFNWRLHIWGYLFQLPEFLIALQKGPELELRVMK